MNPKLLIIIFLLPSLLRSETTEDMVKKAMGLYENRHLSPSHIKESIELFEKILSKEPNNEEALWGLSRDYYACGDTTKDKKERLSFYEKGKEYAEKVIQINEKNPEGHFWFAVNYGRIGQTKGVLRSLFMVPRLKKEFNRTLELNPNHTGALDGLGVLYYTLPKISGGNIKKSIQYLEKANKIDPNYTIIYIDLARAYIKLKDYKKARELLKKDAFYKKSHPSSGFYIKGQTRSLKVIKEDREEKLDFLLNLWTIYKLS